jgi:hypothetical protein
VKQTIETSDEILSSPVGGVLILTHETGFLPPGTPSAYSNVLTYFMDGAF